LCCYDFVPDAWAPWVTALDALLPLHVNSGATRRDHASDCDEATHGAGPDETARAQRNTPQRLSIRSCDITDSAQELDEQLTAADLYLFSYVLTETRGKWRGFVERLFKAAHEGAILLCAEPTNWQLKALLALLDGEPLRSCWLDVRATAAAPSVLLLQKLHAQGSGDMLTE